MSAPTPSPHDLVFSASTRAIQTRKGSREACAQLERARGRPTEIDAALRIQIEAQTSVFLATAGADGQPYVQHRGGPPGFLRVLDARTLGFVDYVGNRQYISQGNLSENAKALIFLMDWGRQRRCKLWGTARVVENDAALLRLLAPPPSADAHGAPAGEAEQAILFHITTWDRNCPSHIPQRMEAAEVQAALAEQSARILALQTELAQLRAATAGAGP